MHQKSQSPFGFFILSDYVRETTTGTEKFICHNRLSASSSFRTRYISVNYDGRSGGSQSPFGFFILSDSSMQIASLKRRGRWSQSPFGFFILSDATREYNMQLKQVTVTIAFRLLHPFGQIMAAEKRMKLEGRHNRLSASSSFRTKQRHSKSTQQCSGVTIAFRLLHPFGLPYQIVKREFDNDSHNRLSASSSFRTQSYDCNCPPSIQ